MSNSNENYCESCNCRIVGVTAWRQHLESKAHRRHELTEDQFTFNAEDMFLEDDAPTMLLLSKFKFPMIGLEFIVEDRTCAEIKCVLCRVILKTTTLVDHIKSYKHQQLYVERVYPEEHRKLQLKCQKKGDLSSQLPVTCESLLRQYGRQKIRIYEKGYAEKRRLQVAQNRLKEVTQFASDIAANVDDFEELPKNERVVQMLLNSKLESFKEGDGAFVNEVVKDIPGPVIGLEYIAEYRDPNEEYEPGYLCTTCESLLNSAQLVTHVVSDKHRMKYLERNYKNYYSLITFKNFSEERKKELLKKYSTDVEKTKGRGGVTLKLIVAPEDSTSLFRYHKRIKMGTSHAANNFDPSGLSKTTASGSSGTSYVQHADMQRSILSAIGAYQRAGASGSLLPSLISTLGASGQHAANLAFQNTALPSSSLSFHSAQQARLSGTDAIQAGLSASAKFVSVPPPGALQLQAVDPARLVYNTAAPSRATIIQPRKPTHVYSEKTELMNKMMEMERHVPPYRQYNLDSGWYSERAYTIDYYAELVAPLRLGYLSIRYPHANPNLYLEFSPYLMRRLQDQFNFKIEHLAWLADQFVRWRMPMYEPLNPTDLRPLEEEVEQAVLDVLVYRVLKTAAATKKPKITEYPLPEKSESATNKEDKEIISYDYNHNSDEPPAKKFKRSEWVANMAKNSLPDSSNSKSGNSKEESTPAEENRETQSPGAGSAMLTVCEQILETARSSGVKNSVLRLLLNFDNAEKVLCNVALKEPDCLSKIISYVQNPTTEISDSTLNDFKQIFSKFSRI